MRSWQEWSRALVRGIASVPDAELLCAAHLFSQAALVLTAGNGGSSAIASHAAQALLKPDYAAGGGVGAVCLTDCVPALSAHANDGGWGSALVEIARPFMALKPTLLAISSSGKSENVVALARSARDLGCPIVAMTGFAGTPLRELATISLHVDSDDYEVVEPVHDALLHRIQYHVRQIAQRSAA